MALEVKSVDLLGMPVAYACAVKAGPWVFLTGHEAFDWETGEVDTSVSGPAGFSAYGTHHRSRREADYVLYRMTRLLREYGIPAVAVFALTALAALESAHDTERLFDAAQDAWLASHQPVQPWYSEFQ